MPEVPAFHVGSWLRLVMGLLLAIIAGCLLALGQRLDWGMAWICWVPAIILMLPALNLVRRTHLVAEIDGFTLVTGWLFRRGYRFGLAGAELEFVLTAGLWTVVFHRQGNHVPLASWLTRRRAEALAAWLDAVSGTPLPRTEAARPERDV